MNAKENLMGNAKELTTANFKSEVATGVTLVDFWAEWCPPCRAIAPVVEQLVTEYHGKAIIAKVNVDNERELAEKFSVMNIPTLIVLKNGEEFDRIIGATSKDNLVRALDKALA
jgi:thioredoxin 1